MKINQNNAGAQAEALDATFLKQQGLKFVAQNYHCRFGEIDLIMQQGNTLVYVEVRLRTNSQIGNAASSITQMKQQKLILTAQHNLQQHGEQANRFIAILMHQADIAHIEWLRHAFDA